MGCSRSPRRSRGATATRRAARLTAYPRLLAALAATGRYRDPLIWLLALALWLSPAETPATLSQAWLIPALACAIALRTAAHASERSHAVTEFRLGLGP